VRSISPVSYVTSIWASSTRRGPRLTRPAT
jgi:hypothetical protein